MNIRKCTVDTFLVLVDSTPECIPSLHSAVEHAFGCGAKVVMLYVFSSGTGEGVLWPAVSDAMRSDALKAAGDRLMSLANDMWKDYGMEVMYKILEGNGKSAIISHSEEYKNGCVIFSCVSLFHNQLGSLVLSMKEGALSKLWCPIFVIPDKMPPHWLEDKGEADRTGGGDSKV